MDRLTRYFLFGGFLIVVGVVMVALSLSGLPTVLPESLAILGVVALALGFVMVLGALIIDLTQLNRERSKTSPSSMG